jgi:hypothetical protein
MYSKHKGVVDLLVQWVTSLDDTAWTLLQLTNNLRDLADNKSLAQDEMYKILESKTVDAIKKRALAVLEVLRQIP